MICTDRSVHLVSPRAAASTVSTRDSDRGAVACQRASHHSVDIDDRRRHAPRSSSSSGSSSWPRGGTNAVDGGIRMRVSGIHARCTLPRGKGQDGAPHRGRRWCHSPIRRRPRRSRPRRTGRCGRRFPSAVALRESSHDCSTEHTVLTMACTGNTQWHD